MLSRLQDRLKRAGKEDDGSKDDQRRTKGEGKKKRSQQDVKMIKRLVKHLSTAHPRAWQNPRTKGMYRKLLEGTYECDFSKLDVENLKMCISLLRLTPNIKIMRILFLSRSCTCTPS
mmetsp:Transcript_20114/g.40625  ORF Transcript_20114/g.40625 Transcript_20114/m.40625 type:complete len:117 (+) Transcript_20114:129-479(+)